MTIFLIFLSINFILYRYFPFNKQSVFKLVLILVLLLIIFVSFDKINDYYDYIIDNRYVFNFAFSLIFRHTVILFNAKLFYESKKQGINYYFPRDLSKELFFFITIFQFLANVL